MTRTLIVYHSRSGHTRNVALALARRLGADLEEVRIVQPMPGALGYVLCAIEAIAGLAPALRASHRDPADYDLVLVGTPVWFWSVSSPMRSWLESHRQLRGRVAFFCTMGGSGATRVFEMMSRICHRAPVATLAMTEAEVVNAKRDQLDAFIGRLQAPALKSGHRPSSRARRHGRHAGAAA